MSLSWLCRWCLGPLLRHARPWSPRALTALLYHTHTHKCVVHRSCYVPQLLALLHHTVVNLPVLSAGRGASHRCGEMMQLAWPYPCIIVMLLLLLFLFFNLQKKLHYLLLLLLLLQWLEMLNTLSAGIYQSQYIVLDIINRTIISRDKRILLSFYKTFVSAHTLNTAHTCMVSTLQKGQTTIRKSSAPVHKNVTRLKISGIWWSVESFWKLVVGRKKESSWSVGGVQNEK